MNRLINKKTYKHTQTPSDDLSDEGYKSIKTSSMDQSDNDDQYRNPPYHPYINQNSYYNENGVNGGRNILSRNNTNPNENCGNNIFTIKSNSLLYYNYSLLHKYSNDDGCDNDDDDGGGDDGGGDDYDFKLKPYYNIPTTYNKNSFNTYLNFSNNKDNLYNNINNFQ